jgi:hypothetical protein
LQEWREFFIVSVVDKFQKGTEVELVVGSLLDFLQQFPNIVPLTVVSELLGSNCNDLGLGELEVFHGVVFYCQIIQLFFLIFVDLAVRLPP